jgi:alpha-ketoglutarate-dependent taurine dioxygenase
LTDELQKELAQRLGELSGKPETSKLHIHPVRNAGNRLGGNDNEISVISSDLAKQLFKERSQSGKSGWHSDITFEPVPSDYAILRMTQLPKSGGGKFREQPESWPCG